MGRLFVKLALVLHRFGGWTDESLPFNKDEPMSPKVSDATQGSVIVAPPRRPRMKRPATPPPAPRRKDLMVDANEKTS